MSERWSKVSLSSVFEPLNVRLGPHVEEPMIFAVSKYEGIVPADEYFNHRVASKALDGYKVVKPGDWVYSTIHIDEGSIAVNHSSTTGVVSPMYTTLSWKPTEHLSSYFELLLRSRQALNLYRDNAQGTVNRRRSLNWRTFGQLQFLVPPLDEQRRIVDLVASVDAYIAGLEKQAEAARTARNAVLHDLLTTGTENWKHLPLGDVAEVLDRKRKPISGAEREKRFGSVPYYGATGQTGWIDKPLFNEELVLLGEDAIDFLNPEVHKAYLINGPSWVNNHAHVLRARKNVILSYFLMEALNAVDYSQFVAFGTRSKLTQGSMMGIQIPVPPIGEQRRITELVTVFDNLLAKSEAALSSSKGFRAGLLSELLSGLHEIPESYDKLIGAT